jgi:hypothetical protein
MKTLHKALLLSAGITFLVACGGKKAGSIVGTWTVVSAEGPNADMNKGVVYTITDKQMNTTYSKGNYTIVGDTILNLFEGMETPFKYVYKLDGKQLKMELLGSGGQKFVLEQK